MKKRKRFFSSLVAASVLTLNVSAFPTNSIYDFCSAKAFAEETVELSDGEYPVNLSVDCYESDRSATFSDYFRIDLAKLIVSTNQTTNQKQYYLCLPVDYFQSSLFNSISSKFGYSFSKYSSEDNISFGDIVSQEGYTSFNENVAVSDLSQLSDDTSANCYMYKVALQNLNDELYIYFSDRFSSNERLLIKVNDIGSTQKYEHYSPEVSNFTFNKVQELYYQDTKFNTQCNFECKGFPCEFIYEYQIDEGNGYSEPYTVSINTKNGRKHEVAMMGEIKQNDKQDADVSFGYVIKNHEAHTMSIKARVGAKYRDTDEVFWSDYSELSANIAKAGTNLVYSQDTVDDFVTNITPRLYSNTNYVIPYDTVFSISKISDESILEDIENLLKEDTGRTSVEFSALNLNLTNPNGIEMSEIISKKYTSWSQFKKRAFTLPTIKTFDVNNMGVYRYEDGRLINQADGGNTLISVVDDVTQEEGFCFQPDSNGPAGIYVFIQADYSDYNIRRIGWYEFEAHLFETDDNQKQMGCNDIIANNRVHSYYSSDDAYIYVNLTDILGKYADNFKYKPAGSDSYTEAEVIETVEKDGKIYPSVIRIPMTSTSAYIPLSFIFNGETKKGSLGVSYNSSNIPMQIKPSFSEPNITIKDADGNNNSELTNSSIAYVSIDAPENGQKLLYTLTADNEVIAENQQYTEPLELKAQSDDGTVYTLKTWVEAANADAASSLANSAVVSEEISFSAKGSYAETAEAPVIGVQYKSGDSLDDATFKVTITSETDGATIYYTVDGSEPTIESAVYNEPFTVNGLTNGNATVIKALAVKENSNDSETVQKTVEFKTGWWDNLLPNSEYSIPVSMVQFLDPTMLSMGNSAIAGNAIFKTDADNNKSLIIPFKSINIGGIEGYVIHYWYFPDEEKAYNRGWATYMLDYECEYTYNSNGTIKTITLPVYSDEDLIPTALEANVDIMGKQETYIKPDYSSIIEEITGEKQEKDAVDNPEINTVLSTYGSRIDTTFSMPESSEYSDADIYYIISTDENLTWDDSKATKYDSSKPITITVADTNANGMTNIYAVAKYGDKQSIVSTKKIMFDTEKAPKLEGYVGVLSDYVGLAFQFKMNSELVAGNPIAQLEVAGQTSNAKIEVLSTDSSGVSTCRFIAKLDAKQMTDVVTANIIVGDETVATFTGCVKDYADTIIANENGEYSDKAIAAAKAMLNYGGYSQVLFDYNTDDLANASIDTDVSSVTADSLIDYLPTKTGSDDTAKFAGYNLYLDSLTRMRFYYTGDATASSTAANYTTSKSGSKNYVEITDITPANLLNGYDVTIGGMTVHASPASYAHTALSKSTDENLQNAMKAMILYSQAATAYDASK